MKKIPLLLLILSILSRFAVCQDFPYGKNSNEEMDMKKYDRDTSANAVVLNEFGKAEITEINDGMRLVYEYHVKIKLFNHNAFSHGTVEIKIRNNEDNNLADEMNNIAGTTTYKDDNGIIQTVALDPKKVYKTRDYKYQSTLKFAMPGLQDGCIIEYHYILVSPFFEHFHDWQFQSEIPKIHTEYDAKIPGFWRYNVVLKGPLKLSKSFSDIEPDCFSARAGKCGCVKMAYAMDNVPAFIREDFMTAPKNFIASLNFDLIESVNPYTGIKTTSTLSWKDIDYDLKTNPGFGDQLKKKNFVKDHMPAEIFGITDTLTRARTVYRWIQNWFKWNNYTGIYSVDGIKKAIEDHSGGVAEINISLVNALNVAGINTEAVLLSTRDHGNINKLYPEAGDFNYLIAETTIGNKNYFLDGTDALLPFGTLPVKCLNDQGRAFSLDKPSYWIDVDTRQTKVITYAIDITLQENGVLKGTLNYYSGGYDAYLKRREIKKFNSIDEYVENKAAHLHSITILKSKIINADSLDAPLNEEYDIEIRPKSGTTRQRILWNPYILDRIINNPFKLAERNYPVDLGMRSENRFIITIHIPVQYVIENKLGSQALSLPNKGGKFITTFDGADNTFTFSSEIEFSKAIYQPEEYAYLKEFYNAIILAQKEELIIRKKS